MKSLTFYDTTLRDGAQGEGVSFTVDDKIKIVKKLDDFGIDYIEGGWPGSNPKDEEFFAAIRDLKLKHSKIVAFSSTKRYGIDIKDDLNIKKMIDSGVDTVAIFGKSWDFHVTDVLKISLDENLALIEDTIKYLLENNMQVIFDAEHFFDGFASNPTYALETLKVAYEAGAEVLVLCDTNGGQLPTQLASTIGKVKESLTAPLGIHAHNDSDVAVANSLLAYELGAVQIQGTIGGIGERCGNADLASIIPALKTKYKLELSNLNVNKITSLYYYIMEVANLVPENNHPYVGSSAFTHKAGMHVNALQKNSETYEHVSPQIFGNKRRILVSELSGKSNLKYKLQELGFDLSNFTKEEYRSLATKIKDMEYQGYQFEGAEASLKLLFLREYEDYHSLFGVEDFKIISHNFGKKTDSEAVVKLKVKGESVHIVAEGDGPVNALDNALRKALLSFFPSIDVMKLIDYKVRVLNGKDGTAAKVRVLIESSNTEQSWTTIGVSTNIIQASWQALIDSFEYALYLAKNNGSLSAN
ncbi:citramalate synthase [Iocasia frigidifontis]|uniref:Citramalate synthase n=1 Tax=Iocasia fonsfrigidae TaxID=2682810 RepID=A0A8A7KNH1_9FIRM|nr:citramalate synthase [Iocasia fonsfrigidae]QTL99392.1 citramalate synthase [Iocasia fonsfrigidae]